MDDISTVQDVVETQERVSAPQTPAPKDVQLSDEVELKIDGKLVKMTREKAMLMAQKGAAADRRFAEAAKAKSEADELLGAAKQKEFLKLAEKAGMTRAEAREALEQTLISLYEEEQQSPEERELKELRKLKAQKDQDEQTRKAAEEQEKITKEEQKYLEQLENDLVEALEKSILPPSPIYAKLSANYLSAALANDVELTPQEAVKLVEQDQLVLVKQIVNTLSADKLEALLGAKAVKAIRDQGVKAVKDSESRLKPTPKPAGQPQVSKEADKKPAQSRSFFDEIRRKNGII